MALKTDAAESNEISCSPLRPPKRMPTRSLFIVFQCGREFGFSSIHTRDLQRMSFSLVHTLLCHPERRLPFAKRMAIKSKDPYQQCRSTAASGNSLLELSSPLKCLSAMGSAY